MKNSASVVSTQEMKLFLQLVDHTMVQNSPIIPFFLFNFFPVCNNMISQCSLKSVNNHNVEILKVNTRDASVIFPF